MTISIAAPVSKATVIRNLAQLGLSEDDIFSQTGYPRAEIKAALSRKGRFDRPKSRVVMARGPLSRSQMTGKLRHGDPGQGLN